MVSIVFVNLSLQLTTNTFKTAAQMRSVFTSPRVFHTSLYKEINVTDNAGLKLYSGTPQIDISR